MNPALYSGIFLVLIVLMLNRQSRQRNAAAYQIQHPKSQEEIDAMLELARRLIGKECTVYTLNGEGFTGILTEVTDSAVLIDGKRASNIVNVSYIVRICETKKKA